MTLHSEDEALMCRLFPASLTESAMKWFYRLPDSSIDTFEQLAAFFIAHYLTSCVPAKDVSSLFDLHRGKGTLREYIAKFKAEMLVVKEADHNSAMVAFRKGLDPNDELRLSLAGRPPKNLLEMYERASEYCLQEDEKKRGQFASPPQERYKKREDKYPAKNFTKRPRAQEVHRAEEELPIKLSLAALYKKIKHEDFLPKAYPMKTNEEDRDQSRHCAYHNAKGHTTDECWNLQNQVKKLIRQGLLKEYITSNKKPNLGPKHKAKETTPEKEDSHNIHVIFGGSIDTLPTNGTIRAMKKAATYHQHINNLEFIPEVSTVSLSRRNCLEFTDDDLVPISMPHADALVITVKISNFNMFRSLVDTGSSGDIIFRKAFDKMRISHHELTACTCPLVGFNGNITYAIGKLKLIVTLGPVSVPIEFMIVDAPSSYNAILGRGWIHKMKAVPSTYHQLIKFPTPEGVMQVRSDQVASIECDNLSLQYLRMTISPKKKNSEEGPSKRPRASLEDLDE